MKEATIQSTEAAVHQCTNARLFSGFPIVINASTPGIIILPL